MYQTTVSKKLSKYRWISIGVDDEGEETALYLALTHQGVGGASIWLTPDEIKGLITILLEVTSDVLEKKYGPCQCVLEDQSCPVCRFGT